MNPASAQPLTDDFQLGCWRVQPRAGFIDDGDRSIRLEPKAMNVLTVLAGARGEVVSRQELLDQVWPGQVVTDDVLTTVISTLRRHLGDDSRESRFIETVPKRGYRLIAPVTPPTSTTPDLASPPQSSAPDDDGRPRRSRRFAWGAGLVLVCALALLVWRQSTNEVSAPPGETGSIAVLPFDVFGDEPRLDVFADGLAEELIHQLSADASLKVTSRTSSFQFRSGGNVREIARTLGVRNILEGSVRGDASLLRVTVQLIDAHNDVHIWSRIFDVQSGALLAMQEKVSNEVVALISGSREATMLQTRLRHPVPNEAYRLYLLGQSQMRAATVDAYERAAENFSDALKIAPNYPIALTQYAAVRMLLHQYRRDDLETSTAAAREALDRALEIDPDLAEAQAVYGLMHTYNKDFKAAEARFETALAKRPNMSFALHNYAFMLWSQGRPRDVIEPARRALEIDPISGPYFALADSLANLGRMESSRSVYEQWTRAVPNNGNAYLGHSSVERLLGNLEAAVRLADEAAKQLPDDYVWLHTTRLGLALYQQDFVEAERLKALIDRELPAENFVLRTGLLLAQREDALDDFQVSLDTLRGSMDARDQATEALDWIEAHVRYLMGDCDGVLALYDHLLADSSTFVRSHWSIEFGHAHLVNLMHCQQLLGQATDAELVASVRRDLVDGPEVTDYPANLYLRARLYQLDGEPDRAAAILRELEARNWPFLWLVDQEPVFRVREN